MPLKSGRAGFGVQSSSAIQSERCSWVCASKVTPGASIGRFHPTLKLLMLVGMGKGGDTEHHKGLYGEGKILNLENLTFNHGCSSMCVSSATLQTEILSVEVQTHCFCCLPGPLLQLVDVCINASYMKYQLWSMFVKYISRALYLTDCELMSVECEIPFLKLLLSLAFFLWTVSLARTAAAHTTAFRIVLCLSDVPACLSFEI